MLKDEFISKINEIKDEKLKEAAMSMLNNVPEYFWSVAASSSGKYHPKISLGDGGLARHSLMVCIIAQDLLNADIFDVKDIAHIEDMIIIAALFHDSIKRGKNSEQTIFEHPLASAKFVNYYLTQAGIDRMISAPISRAIASHMGKWNTSQYSSTILPIPMTQFEKLIHTADYIASRKYIGGLETWINNNSNK